MARGALRAAESVYGGGKPPMPTLAETVAGRCVCRRCKKRCDRCECPRPVKVYTSSRAARKADAKRRKAERRTVYLTTRKRKIAASGGCVDCGGPQREGSSRCEPCLAKIAGRKWRREMIEIISDEHECQHTHDPRTARCQRCARCIAAWVTAHETELRETVAAARSSRIAAASAAREKWRERRDASQREWAARAAARAVALAD